MIILFFSSISYGGSVSLCDSDVTAYDLSERSDSTNKHYAQENVASLL